MKEKRSQFVISLSVILGVATLTTSTLLLMRYFSTPEINRQADQSIPATSGPVLSAQPTLNPEIHQPAETPSPPSGVDMSTAPPEQPDIQPLVVPSPATTVEANPGDNAGSANERNKPAPGSTPRSIQPTKAAPIATPAADSREQQRP